MNTLRGLLFGGVMSASLMAEALQSTYSASTSMALGGTATTVNLQQFDSQGGLYTLTRVVLSIDGSIYGTLKYDNENSTQTSGAEVLLTSNFGGNQYGYSSATINGLTATERYYEYHSFSLGADSDGAADFIGSDAYTINVNNLGYGATTADISSALDSFIGSGTLVATVNSKGNWTTENLGNGQTDYSITSGQTVSITYYYDPVPEPTTTTLLGLGFAALLIRRRRRQG